MYIIYFLLKKQNDKETDNKSSQEEEEEEEKTAKCNCCFCTKNKCCNKNNKNDNENANANLIHLHNLNQLKIFITTKQKFSKPVRVNIQNNAKYIYTFSPATLKFELDKFEVNDKRRFSSFSNNNNNNNYNSIYSKVKNVNLARQEFLTRLVIAENCKLCKKLLRSHPKLFTKAPINTNEQIENGSVLIDPNLLYLQSNGGRDRLNTTVSTSTANASKDHKLFKKNLNTCSFCCCCCCCCLPCGLKKFFQKSKFCLLCDSTQEKLKIFVDGRFFQRAILFAILINTLSMGVEHHLQVNFEFFWIDKIKRWPWKYQKNPSFLESNPESEFILTFLTSDSHTRRRVVGKVESSRWPTPCEQ